MSAVRLFYVVWDYSLHRSFLHLNFFTIYAQSGKSQLLHMLSPTSRHDTFE